MWTDFVQMIADFWIETCKSQVETTSCQAYMLACFGCSVQQQERVRICLQDRMHKSDSAFVPMALPCLQIKDIMTCLLCSMSASHTVYYDHAIACFAPLPQSIVGTSSVWCALPRLSISQVDWNRESNLRCKKARANHKIPKLKTAGLCLA